MKNILIIGATSAIAHAYARKEVEGNNFYLVARNEERLQSVEKDLQARGAASIASFQLDLNETDRHQEMLAFFFDDEAVIDTVLIAHGSLPNQEQCVFDPEQTIAEVNTNGVSAIALLALLAERFKRQKKGSIVVITSVAGDRGRQSNYVYGAAKSMLSTYLQGLRNYLTPDNVDVIEIKPGFVDTPMTASFDKGPLWAKPETIADIIVKAVAKRQRIVYAPFFWRYIMLIIRNIPEFIFVKLKL